MKGALRNLLLIETAREDPPRGVVVLREAFLLCYWRALSLRSRVSTSRRVSIVGGFGSHFEGIVMLVLAMSAMLGEC